ncbi:type II secretion system protein XpsI [Marilutibacter spongiae]|uniref:Prepilin-type N-terminal cleavage/methylation domain-containing protein n=1 Tax=Marilutibacter spongiae TaxID=2025720 RepID=A0A7W3Y4G0_9GAMM|nr:prepilin-type N-terminal cleavage/methylation domain-containing protein [Lysobacter spongiae]MBB1059072.1 prepilin-type N-terminal cleavage/methylation domain-containing protein [Lysobacter spongiae]
MRHPPRHPSRRQRGYTLIEVIVAFALLALALGLLLGTLSGATRQVRWSGDAGRAALHAQSLIDQMGIAAPIRAGRDAGDFEDGRYRWTMEITPWEDPDVPPDTPLPVNNNGNRLYEIALAVEWGEGGSGEHLRLRTLRLVQGGLEEAP